MFTRGLAAGFLVLRARVRCNCSERFPVINGVGGPSHLSLMHGNSEKIPEVNSALVTNTRSKVIDPTHSVIILKVYT